MLKWTGTVYSTFCFVLQDQIGSSRVGLGYQGAVYTSASPFRTVTHITVIVFPPRRHHASVNEIGDGDGDPSGAGDAGTGSTIRYD